MMEPSISSSSETPGDPECVSPEAVPTPPDPAETAEPEAETPISSASEDALLETESESPLEVEPVRLRYSEMKLIRPLMEAIEHAGYEFATPVQESVIPIAMRGKDVIGQAQTGTGKTAAFLIPFMNRWRPHTLHGPIGLVMCPTRELAMQVANEAHKLAPSSRLKTVAVYGGARMGRQLEQLAQGCDLVVGTPGRMLDHLRRGSMSLDHVRYVVLDEADRMLDIGFRPDIERILRKCPEQRQTLLMSATVPDTIKRLVHRYMKDPIHLSMSPGTLTVDKIRQTFITVDDDKKFELLKRVFEREEPKQCIIFVERKRWADRLYRQMRPIFPRTAVIHGDLPQSHREKIMAGFRAGKVRYLIATDVASRGIDVTGISHVINYDLPTDIENYVHRIGRTGRIGRDGVAVAFVTPEQGPVLTQIEITINRLIDEDRIEGFEAYTPRKRPVDPPQPSTTVTDEGEVVENAPEDQATAAKKPIFGRNQKRYSSRL